MLPKPIDMLTYTDVAAMVEGGLREGRTIDLKQAPVGNRDEDKREFLADVSALANTAGGDIVFGITEAQGEATGAPGVELANADAEILRLESILRSGLEPRLPKLDMRWLPRQDGRGLLIVRTPRSYLGPHRVSFRDHAKFYGRTNAGKAALDVAELRAAFLSAEGVDQRIRSFRKDRLGIIEGGEGPGPAWFAASAVLHIIPLEAFAAERDIGIDRNTDRLLPLGSTSCVRARHTMEGFVTFSGLAEAGSADDYALLFRSGIIESAALVGHEADNGWCIPAANVEYAVLSVFEGYRRKLAEKGIALPVYVFLSLLGVRDHYLAVPDTRFQSRHRLRTDALLLPAVVITEGQQASRDILRPLFDRLHNAFGFERSLSFDAVVAQVGT